MSIKHLSILFLALLLAALPVAAQQGEGFSMTSFKLDPSATTRERQDAGGHYMALVKVTTNDPERLGEYIFDFGYLSSVKDSHDHGNELWLYVQRNARHVTITSGNIVREYDLDPMIEAGRVYNMYIKSERPLHFQMVRFEVTPQMAGTTVFIKGSNTNEELLGITDAGGSVAKNLRHDRYTYRVIAEQYKESQGEFVLNDDNTTHIERVALLPNFAEVTFTVDADADIYINNEKRGHKTWTGRLKADDYQVECRQANHHSSRKFVKVVANENRTVTLDKPVPITGKLSINSTPLDATITIDGKDYGTTPRNLDIIIGQHRVVVSKQNHQSYEQTVEVKEGQIVEVEAKLNSKVRITIGSKPAGATLFIDGKQMGTTPHATEMTSGEYRIKMTKEGFKTFDKRVHIDVSNPNVNYKMSRRYFKPTSGYIQAGFQAGALMGPAVSVGGYIAHVGIEVFGCYGIDSETVYGLSTEGDAPVTGKLSPLVAGGKLGCGIEAGTRVRITPQAGFGIVTAKSDVVKLNASFASIGIKTECAIAPHMSLFVTPQYRFAVKKSDAFERIAAMSSKVKGWGTGFDATLGLSINF